MIAAQKDCLTAAVVALARHNIPTDIQELLVAGNPMMGVAPGALEAALSRLRDKLERVETKLEQWRISEGALGLVLEGTDNRLRAAEAEVARLTERLAEALEALAFYANKDDGGKRARQALVGQRG